MSTTRMINSFCGLVVSVLAVVLAFMPQVARAFPISLGGPCPGWKSLDWSGAGAGNMAVLVSNGPGNTVIPGGPCVGTALGLSSSGLRLVDIISTQGGSGRHLYITNPAHCGKFIQCIKTDTCDTSNVAGPI